MTLTWKNAPFPGPHYSCPCTALWPPNSLHWWGGDKEDDPGWWCIHCLDDRSVNPTDCGPSLKEAMEERGKDQ